MRLENWQIVSYMEPFCEVAIGDIYDDEKKRFKDGTTIKTSAITKKLESDGEIIGIITRNSTYELGEKAEGTRMMPHVTLL